METLPAELIRQVVLNVDSFLDLTSLSRVCRYLHAEAIPLIYEDVTLDLQDIYTPKDSLSHVHGAPPPCVAQLQAMARNSQGQCQYVRRLSVVNSGDLPVINNLMNPSEFVANLGERDSMQFFVNFLLEMAVSAMRRLAEFEWTALVYPSNGIFSALSKHRLCSLTYRHPAHADTSWGPDPDILLRPTGNCLSEYDPDIRIIDMSGLTSLSLLNLGTDNAADDTADLLFYLRKQLKALRLGVVKSWRRMIEIDEGSPDLMEGVMEYNTKCSRDTLYPFIHRFTLTDEPEPMQLEQLEIRGASDAFDTPTWLRAFDFHTIRRFALIGGSFHTPTAVRTLWDHLEKQQIAFTILKTDIECVELNSFLQSSKGLESLFFQSHDMLFYGGDSDDFTPDAGPILEEVIRNCPLLEEVGIYLNVPDHCEGAFKIFDDCPSLKRLYITSARRIDYNLFTPEEFLRFFFSYFAPRDSFLFNRLELLSFETVLWEIVSTELNDAEREDMEYELEYELLSDCELETLDSGGEHDRVEIDGGSNEQGSMESSEEDRRKAIDDDDDDEEEEDPFHWLTEPECYTWERVRSGYSRMPVKTSWVHYLHDDLVRTVYEAVMLDEP